MKTIIEKPLNVMCVEKVFILEHVVIVGLMFILHILFMQRKSALFVKEKDKYKLIAYMVMLTHIHIKFLVQPVIE